jgi:hypothetical protein
LRLKPGIHAAHEDGKYTTLGKARTLRRCLEEIVGFMVERYG